MVKPILPVLQILTISLLLAFGTTITSRAHEGHSHNPAPGTETAGGEETEVTLSNAAIHNLGIKTVPANLSELSERLDMNATVSFLPEKHAQISPRVEGKVKEIYVQIGEKISKNQKLLAIVPVYLGSRAVIIKSPIDGFITAQNVVIGQSATKDTVVMEVADPSEVLVTGKAFETPKIARLKVGQKVTVSTPTYPSKVFIGSVQRIDITLKTNSRTLDVYALVKNPNRRLLANMQAVLSVAISKAEPILAVPSRAILGDGGNKFLYVKNNNKFERRNLMLGKKYGPLREIIEGVFPDEEIVVEGHYQLQFTKPSKKKDLKDNSKSS